MLYFLQAYTNVKPHGYAGMVGLSNSYHPGHGTYNQPAPGGPVSVTVREGGCGRITLLGQPVMRST